jgi:hypothetical protein
MRHASFRPGTFTVLLLTLAAPACAVREITFDKVPVQREWTLAYHEIIRVESDPPGATVEIAGQRVTAPSDVAVAIGTAHVREQGFASYRAVVFGIELGDDECEEERNAAWYYRGGEVFNTPADPTRTSDSFIATSVASVRPAAPVRWEGLVVFRLEPTEVTATASHPGFQTATTKVIISETEEACGRALKQLILNDPQNPPPKAVGRRTIHFKLTSAAAASAGPARAAVQ